MRNVLGIYKENLVMLRKIATVQHYASKYVVNTLKRELTVSIEEMGGGVKKLHDSKYKDDLTDRVKLFDIANDVPVKSRYAH